MRNRRFLILAAVLVGLNTGLWLTPQGLALRQIALPQLYGKNMVRADVLLNNGSEWYAARGVITQANSSQLTLKEADGRLQTIGISSGTNVIGSSGPLPQSAVTRGWRAVVTWPASSGIADLIKLEKRVKSGGGTDGTGGSHSHK
jgi:hypothetical protein